MNARDRIKKLANTLKIAQNITIRDINTTCPLYQQQIIADGYLVKPCQGDEQRGLGTCGAFKGQEIQFVISSDFDKARKLKGVKCSYKQ
jgi:hypothetical protein